MSQKEEIVLNEIKRYFKENKSMPSIRYLQKKLKYKSTNSIYLYLKSLEKQKYLIRNINNQLVLKEIDLDNNIKTINIINSNETITLMLNRKKQYIGFKLNNNYFINKKLCKGDILIIELNKKIKNNDLGLFIIDNNYALKEYSYIDGFYHLIDKEELILYKVNIIGKVIMTIRKTGY